MSVQDSAPQTVPHSNHPGFTPAVLSVLGPAVERLRYGQVQLTVHDGKIVQLDVTERQRF